MRRECGLRAYDCHRWRGGTGQSDDGYVHARQSRPARIADSKRGIGRKSHTSGSSGVRHAIDHMRNMEAISYSSYFDILMRPKGSHVFGSSRGAHSKTSLTRSLTGWRTISW